MVRTGLHLFWSCEISSAAMSGLDKSPLTSLFQRGETGAKRLAENHPTPFEQCVPLWQRGTTGGFFSFTALFPNRKRFGSFVERPKNFVD